MSAALGEARPGRARFDQWARGVDGDPGNAADADCLVHGRVAVRASFRLHAGRAGGLAARAGALDRTVRRPSAAPARVTPGPQGVRRNPATPGPGRKED